MMIKSAKRLLAAVICSVPPAAEAQQSLPPAHVMREADPRERVQWMASMRSYPNRELPAARVAATRELRAGLRFGTLARSYFAERWEPIGPVGFISMNTRYSSTPMTDEGRFTSIALHPRDQRIIWAGSASAGVWRSVNGGASWQSLTDSECSSSIGALAVDPVDPTIVYAGTGEIFDNNGVSDGCGILRSTNGGDLWTRTAQTLLSPPGQLGEHVYRIAIDRATAGTSTNTLLMAATSNGLIRSTNSAGTWSPTALGGDVTDVMQHPANSNVFYAAVATQNGQGNGVYRSTNRGVTWTKITDALEVPTSIGRTALAVSPARPGAVWVLIANPTNRKFRSLSRWDEETGAWTNLPATGILFQSELLDFGEQSEYNLVIGVDPEDANRVIVGGVRLFRSRNGGQSFHQIAANVHSDWHALAFDPQDTRRLVTGCDGGVFTSLNGGDTWRSLNNGITATQFYPGIAVHPTNPGIVVGGTQDNGSMMSGGSLFWAGISYGDGGWAMIDYTNPNIVMTSSQNGNLQRHDLSTRSFQPLNPQYVFQPGFITPFILDPVVPTTIYAATRAFERSTNFGNTFSALSPVLQGQGTALASNSATPRTFFIGSNSGFLAISRNGGNSWVGGTLVQRAISDIASDPNDPQRFGITFSGWGAAKVVLTPDAGVSFFDVTGDLPDIPVNSIMFTPVRNRFFAGTDIGVFETNNAGANWVLTTGMPIVPVMDLVFHAASNRLIAGTYGRGIWSLALATQPAVLRGDVDRNGVVNAADAMLIQQGLAARPLPNPLTVLPHGDANCNGVLDGADPLSVLRFAVGLGNSGACVNQLR
ncbi:MAG: hypothetical protein ACT4OZ_16455 [Gemmatimonadota bacterium]